MYKFYLSLIISLISFGLNAQNSSDKEEIKKVIGLFFKGLHNGDSTLVKKTLHKDIKIQTTYTNKQGKKILVTETKEKLLKAIASKKETDIYLEKLLSYSIKIDGNLASAWTPYEFYFNDKFSHCGANSFQFFNNNGKWEIIYLIDMRRRGNCNMLQEKN